MFKKFISGLIIGFFMLPITQYVNADVSTRVKVDEALLNQRNIIVTHPDTNEQYLLYLGSGCGQLINGQYIDLITDNELDGKDDYVKTDFLHSCKVEKANAFNKKLFVNYTYVSNTEAHIMDESYREYYMDYGQRCSAIERYRGGYIYVYMYDVSIAGGGLNTGDKIILADGDGECPILGLREIQRKYPENAKQDIDKLPSLVSRVKTLPMNGKVALYWSAATDDKGIARYIISYDQYRVNTKNVSFADMPNLIRTGSNATSYVVDGLENDEYYFFYVIAVDTAGNTASDWSSGAMAIPRSSY